MRFAATLLLIAAMLQILTCSARSSADATPKLSMVLTFDDLPYAASSAERNTVPNAQRVTDAIIATLEEYHAPATAFVNEAKLHLAGEFDARRALLQRWVDAGTVLGNHTFSHPDLNSTPIAEFRQEIISGETVMRQLMKVREPYQLYFRHPYTHTGKSESTKEEIDRFLLDRGYKVAPHTIDSQDYIFNAVYLRSREQGDDSAAMRICAAYWDFVLCAADFAENISSQIFERSIPQTLLLHANDLNADCLGELLTHFKRQGYEFVSLDAAMSDPAYATQDTLVTAHGPSWLWRWMKSKGMDISFREDPEPLGWVMDQPQ